MLLLHFHSPKFLANLSIIQNCLLHWLCDTAFYWTFIWSLRDLPPCDHGLWPLCGHLLTSALCDPLEPPHAASHWGCVGQWVFCTEMDLSWSLSAFHSVVPISWWLHMWHSSHDTIACTDSFLVVLLVAANGGMTHVIIFIMLLVTWSACASWGLTTLQGGKILDYL